MAVGLIRKLVLVVMSFMYTFIKDHQRHRNSLELNAAKARSR